MKKAVNTHEAKTQLSRLLKRVTAGEEIVIATRGIPVARLVPIVSGKTKRRLGAYGDSIQISDDFDAPLPDDILDDFEGIARPKKKRKK